MCHQCLKGFALYVLIHYVFVFVCFLISEWTGGYTFICIYLPIHLHIHVSAHVDTVPLLCINPKGYNLICDELANLLKSLDPKSKKPKH